MRPTSSSQNSGTEFDNPAQSWRLLWAGRSCKLLHREYSRLLCQRFDQLHRALLPVLLPLSAMLSRLRATARPEVFVRSRAEMLIKRRVKFAMVSNSWSSTSDGERLHPDIRSFWDLRF